MSSKNIDKIVLLTHNIHFYLNITHQISRDLKVKKNSNPHVFIRLEKTNEGVEIKRITENDEFKTNYDALWKELIFVYSSSQATENMLLNPIRRIIETFTKFNVISLTSFYENNSDVKKLFDVNSHSIDDLEAELNGLTKDEIIELLRKLFRENNFEDHFNSYWKLSSNI